MRISLRKDWKARRRAGRGARFGASTPAKSIVWADADDHGPARVGTPGPAAVVRTVVRAVHRGKADVVAATIVVAMRRAARGERHGNEEHGANRHAGRGSGLPVRLHFAGPFFNASVWFTRL